MTAIEQEVQTLQINKTETIAATPEIVWESVLHHVREFGEPGKLMTFKLEAFPGGRWYRDLGEDSGHLWGHVQVIKPNRLLELRGPMFMSYAATSHVQYKLTAEGTSTRLDFAHTAIGLFPADISDGLSTGWGGQLKQIVERARQRSR